MNHFILGEVVPAIIDPSSLARSWKEDGIKFVREGAPKIALVLLLAVVLIWLLRIITNKVAALQIRKTGMRTQQVRTLAGIVNSVGVFVILFWAAMEILPFLGLNLGPVLASAGIAGLAIGFGAQTLVKDVINGFFIILENQYDIGDVVRLAGVKGTVEAMSLRRTVLRDDDGTVHVVPNSDIQIVSNTTRDWSQFALRVVVAFEEPSERVLGLLREISDQIKHDPEYADDIVSDIQIPGIDRVGNGEAEYLVLVKTRPTKQYPVSRELRRRIKESFLKNNIRSASAGRVYVVDQGPTAQAS